jgi:hypothetical protein
MQPKQFKIKPNGFQEVRRKYLQWLIPILILGVTVGLAISHVNGKKEEDDFSVLAYAIPLCVGFIAFSVYSGLNKSKALFESFTLTLEPNSIIRDQLNTPVIHIYHSEVTDISRMKNGCILIKSQDKGNLIAIPPQIEKREELEAMLGAIKPISESPKLSLAQKYPVVLVLLVLLLIAGVFVTTNVLLVSIGGILLTGFFIWVLYEGSRSKNIDQKTKKGLWWIVVVLLAVVARVIMILSDYI